MNRIAARTAAPALILIAAAGAVLAGPLNPPAGPVASSYKTLTEVEPRTAIGQPANPANGSVMIIINQSGSYYLSSNIVAPAGFQGSGIQIAADNVTLDLNGFSVVGTGLGNSVSSGITADNNTGKRLTLRNGVLRNWAGAGIDTATTGAGGATIENVRAVGNKSNGFSTGPDTLLRSCVASSNTGDGFNTGLSNSLADCSADNNTDAGFAPFASSSLRGCIARFNTGLGFASGGASNLFDGCSARQNSAGGFAAFGGSSLSHCIAESNAGFGFNVSAATVIGCTATSTSGATGDGFRTGSTGIVTDCVASNNTRDGFSLGEDSIADRCNAYGNGGNDFRGSIANTFLNCIASGPTTLSLGANAGFVLTGARNRIEGCQAIRHVRGFEATVTGNIFLRNTASGNTDNYGQVVAGNFIGTIITTAAAFGTNTNANANVSY